MACKHDIDRWQDLAYAVVAQAVEDYTGALRALKRYPCSETKYFVISYERWFRGDWCAELLQGEISADRIIGNLRKAEGIEEADLLTE